jgi:hypothetical protein
MELSEQGYRLETIGYGEEKRSILRPVAFPSLTPDFLWR